MEVGRQFNQESVDSEAVGGTAKVIGLRQSIYICQWIKKREKYNIRGGPTDQFAPGPK